MIATIERGKQARGSRSLEATEEEERTSVQLDHGPQTQSTSTSDAIIIIIITIIIIIIIIIIITVLTTITTI